MLRYVASVVCTKHTLEYTGLTSWFKLTLNIYLKRLVNNYNCSAHKYKSRNELFV